MKKAISLLISVLTLFTVFTYNILAADFENAANELFDMGLFLGTDTGYELERIPTRAEAAVMLVRLLGKESQAKELTYTAPFTDVYDWAKPYVQYLYSNNLTQGTSETSYSPSDSCTAQMYITFILRSLGYSDTEGDFSYDKAIDFAKEKEVINDFSYNEDTFLRDNMVAISYMALYCETEGGEFPHLLDKLVAEGAVSSEKADKQTKLFGFIRNYETLTAPISLRGAYNIINTYTSDVQVLSEKYLSNTKTDNISFIYHPTDASLSTAIINTTSQTEYHKYGQSVNISVTDYYDRGTAYRVHGDELLTAEVEFSDFLSNYAAFDKLEDKLILISSATPTDNGYLLNFTKEKMNEILDTLIGETEMDIHYSDIELKSFEYEIGSLPSLYVNVRARFFAYINGTDFEFTVSTRSELVASGDSVSVVLPN
ncbi:MAG: S-layer homology domain-containing protein [Ruminococcaceae bacterium]|nr:S-layer homology domain-containing protein [Oscillospiraceae bacterium]